jgi:hypothetical protein
MDTFVDFYEEIYATKTNFDWIDGLTGGGKYCIIRYKSNQN